MRHADKMLYQELSCVNGTGQFQKDERMWKMTNDLAVW
jgi:hypothetical protein